MITTEFQKLLEEVFPTWDGENPPDPGRLKVEMSGSGFLRGLDETKGREVVQMLKERLPEDTAFYWSESADRRVVMWEGTNGTGSDLCYVIFSSKEWEPVEEGKEIASIRIDSLAW